MSHINMAFHEGAAPIDDVGGSFDPVDADDYYEVVKPLFKRGRTWEPGEHIKLEREAAQRFLDQGEIKELT